MGTDATAAGSARAGQAAGQAAAGLVVAGGGNERRVSAGGAPNLNLVIVKR
jgi:hypothetical protein